MNRSVAIIGTRGYPSYYGGFETAVRRLAPFLADNDWDVTVYGRMGSTRQDDPDLDARVHAVTTLGVETKAISTLSYGLSSSIHASVRKPDAAIVMNVANGYFLPILRSRGIPTLVNVDGIEWDRDKWGRVAKAVFKGGARMTARFADQVVVDSTEIGRRWDSDFGRQGVFIPYGGDPRPLLPVEPGYDSGGYVLMVARFVPENTVIEFFDAVRLLGGRFPVVIVGSSGYGGELDREAESLAREVPNVSWLGHVSNDARLFALWQHSGAYFHGHSVGGTNPALVQAMALGAPTVARDTVYNREVLGETSIFVASDPQAIANAITRLMTSSVSQESLRQSAMRRAASDYTWQRVGESYLRELENLTAKQRT